MDSVVDLIGGTTGGVATTYIGQPLDTVKVKLQTFPKVYRNTFYCFIKTYKDSGIIRGLYAGTVPSLIANVAEKPILFMAYGLCQKTIGVILKKNVLELNSLQNAVAGSCAAFFSSLALCPTELVKCRLQTLTDQKKLMNVDHGTQSKIGPSHLVRHIIKSEGIRGLYHGLQATFAREMPGYFFFFGGYEFSRRLLTPAGGTKNDLGPLRLLLCGGLAGMSFWVFVFPADVIKSRVQIDKSQIGKHPSHFSMLLSIARNEGVLTLYTGLFPTVVRAFCASAVLVVVYEYTKKLLSPATHQDIQPRETS